MSYRSLTDYEGDTGSSADVLSYIAEVERILTGRTPAEVERRSYLMAHIARQERFESRVTVNRRIANTPPPSSIAPDWFTELIDEVASQPIPDEAPPADDDMLGQLLAELDEAPTPTAPAAKSPTTEDPHRPGRTSVYYFVGYITPTVDGVSELRREMGMEEAPVVPISLTYHQAQSLGLIR